MVSRRNFSIIAHIDHGKSTLADRLIETVGLISKRDFHEQLLDTMEIERERGITIKSQTINLPYQTPNGQMVELNLIDTPGHVDFSYEVSRALACCEGALLVIDASCGVQAQTLACVYHALEHNLVIIPVINKIDLPTADVERTKEEIKSQLGLDPEEALLCSAKEGTGIENVFKAIVERIPPPSGSPEKPLAALIFDAQYDSFRGVVVSIRVFDGEIRPGDRIKLLSSGNIHQVEEVGIFRLRRESCPVLSAGSVGYLIAGLKDVAETRIGDTVTRQDRPVAVALPGFREMKPTVFCSLYPISAEDYPGLADALARYVLNDAAFVYQRESSAALGQGFRCGFLGMLHLEVVQERLQREFQQSVILTPPTVQYRFWLHDGSNLLVDNPFHYPEPARIRSVEEPYVQLTILTPERYLGAVINLCLKRRAVQVRHRFLRPGHVEIDSQLPLADVIFDFHDTLKSITQGYASFDYQPDCYRPADIVKLDILINGEKLDALSMIIHRQKAYHRAVQICEKLKKEIPRHQFQIVIQGAIGGRIIARSTIPAFRKDVTAKCYGGDVTRKRKLLERQKEGKKKMKMVGSVMVPQKAFVAAMKIEE